ncbi:ABC transporter permease subunit [uncultured Subdoligranulum sp.]|uniref:ABC transporter permease subunit n=1 Tax=Candidatus Gemmiger excrementavium TaxID=2838608 RepID=A0A9D2JGQ1_9FIRM|nr:ABC transporter permease subunit [uncultured Subdoligranulum sp.]HIZ48039.1 ABC transporter permease subunit [Candidatus Gemmiger excrementavium]
MNLTLYKKELKGSLKLLVIFAAVLTLYIVMIVDMFDPELADALKQFEQMMPELMAAVGMTGATDTLAGFMITYLYGFLLPVVPMVYTILRANALVARYVDSGSMAALLAAPVPRSRVVRTQLGALYSGIVLLVGYCTAVEWASARLLFPGELAAAELLRMNAGLLALQLLIGSVCFFFSCLCDDTRGSIALGAGLPTLMYLVQMLANMGGKLEPFRYATFFTLYDPTALAAGQAAGWQGAAVLLAAALVLNLAAGAVFRRRDLPL